jgi:hypothetical protein
MCDYSSEYVASRPAKVGDKLITTDFDVMYTTGFCAVGEPHLAVCIKPGTELAFEREIECDALLFKQRAGSQVARFRRVNEDNRCAHHDALELPSGKVVLLTLLVGQRATVLQLPVAERVERSVASSLPAVSSAFAIFAKSRQVRPATNACRSISANGSITAAMTANTQNTAMVWPLRPIARRCASAIEAPWLAKCSADFCRTTGTVVGVSEFSTLPGVPQCSSPALPGRR